MSFMPKPGTFRPGPVPDRVRCINTIQKLLESVGASVGALRLEENRLLVCSNGLWMPQLENLVLMAHAFRRTLVMPVRVF